MPAIEWGWACQRLAKGVEKIGAKPIHGSLAITSQSYLGREECNKCGFCVSGCLSTAKSCTLTGFVPQAEANGAEFRSEAFIYNITYDPKKNRVTGVEYLDVNNKEHHVHARVVIVTAHTFETPRLLFLSANNTFPGGLANSSGLVGKYYTAHWAVNVYGIFDQKMNAFKGPPLGNLIVQDWYETDTNRGFARGYTLESNLPPPFAYGVAGPAFWGQELKDMIKVYDHAAGWWICGEGLADEDNMITLDPKTKDHRGLPVARSTYNWLDNDKKAREHAIKMAATLLEAAGAKKIYVGVNSAACPTGTVRMGNDPKASVVNSYCQSHDIPNLFVCDTSVFPTGGVASPTLTAMAIASRAGEYMVESIKRGDLSGGL